MVNVYVIGWVSIHLHNTGLMFLALIGVSEQC